MLIGSTAAWGGWEVYRLHKERVGIQIKCGIQHQGKREWMLGGTQWQVSTSLGNLTSSPSPSLLKVKINLFLCAAQYKAFQAGASLILWPQCLEHWLANQVLCQYEWEGRDQREEQESQLPICWGGAGGSRILGELTGGDSPVINTACGLGSR